MRYLVISPDALPIDEPFDSHEEAEAALSLWCLRFAGQGYYAAVNRRIPLEQLPTCCRIEAVTEEEEEEPEIDDEPTEGDLFTDDHEWFTQDGKTVIEPIRKRHAFEPHRFLLTVTLNRTRTQHYVDTDDYRVAVRRYMELTQWFPNVWFISDHGNAHLMDLTK